MAKTAAREPHLGPDFLRFLSELADHNERRWFEAQKPRYESSVRDPFLRLIADLAPRMRKLSPPFMADPSPVGGSMMRIYRDIRFARDKTPYKTAVAAHFWPGAGKRDDVPAFYIHLEPGKSSFGGGLWRPAPPLAGKVRDAIAGRAARWRRIVGDLDSNLIFHQTGETLKRVPPGYDAASSIADDLRRKDFIIGSQITDREVVSNGLIDLVASRCEAAMPYMRFLFEAVARSPHERT